jgi:hypothetical protein
MATTDRLKYAKLLKQIIWNRPTFSDGYLVTKLNLDKTDESSFYYKDEDCDIYFEWLTSVKPGILLGKLVNPIEYVSPAVVEKIGNQWKLNKEETDKATKLLSDSGHVAIHCSKEENEPVYILSEVLAENKFFLEGKVLIPKDWPSVLPNLRDHLSELIRFYTTQDVLFEEFAKEHSETAGIIEQYYGQIELISSRTLRKNNLIWDNLTYSYTPESSNNSTRTSTKRSSLSPKEKLAVLVELLESEEMEKLVTVLDSKGVVLNQRSRFMLATELVLGFSSMVVVEDKQ